MITDILLLAIAVVLVGIWLRLGNLKADARYEEELRDLSRMTDIDDRNALVEMHSKTFGRNSYSLQGAKK